MRCRPGACASPFAQIPLFRRRDPPPAGRSARGSRRCAHGALHQSRHRRSCDAGARLLRSAAVEGRLPGRNAPPAMICLVVSGTGRSTVGEHSFDGHNTTCSRSRTGISPATRHWAAKPIFIVSDKVALSDLISCARNTNNAVDIDARRHRCASSPRRGSQISAWPRMFRRRHHAGWGAPLRRGALAPCACAYPTDRCAAAPGQSGVTAVFTGADMAADNVAR